MLLNTGKKRHLQKKIPVSVIIVIILVSSMMAPIRTQADSQQKVEDTYQIIYVGGNQPGTFKTIQSAIHHAHQKDIITILPGIYYETILIDKSITLKGDQVDKTIINGNKIFVSFELRMGNEGEIVAYADQTNFFSNHIVLRNTKGDKVSELERDLVTASLWTWKIKVLDHDHPAGDPLLLQILAGKTAFSDDDATDICNNYFWILAWVFLAAGILIFFLVCAFAYNYFNLT